MIYIEENAPTALPKQHHVSHNFCVELYDLIFDLLKKDAFSDLGNTSFAYKKENIKNPDSLINNEVNVFDWLVSNDKIDILEKVLCKRLLTAIIEDLLNFIYEGLNCSMRGKTTVAYSNFRKPLKDHLTLLEMIFIDPTEFTKNYYLIGNPQNYDPSSRNIDKEKLVKDVLNKLNNPLLNKDIIYSLRFDKSNSNSFDAISNLAIHIVTRDRNYRTEDRNLNFIFSTEEDIEKQWDHIYTFLPYLMIYMFFLTEEITMSLIDVKDEIKEYRKTKAFLLLTYWLKEHHILNSTEEKESFSAKNANIQCCSCNESTKLEKHDLELFFKYNILPCPKCLASRIHFPDEYIPEFMNMEFKKEDFT